MSWKRALLVWLLVGVQLSAASDELEILVDNKKREVDSREREGRLYYELKDLAKIFELQAKENNVELILIGSRGRLTLTDGRPLVRFEDQYILLSAPLWRRKKGQWYIPDDFLTKALPLIITWKLEKVGDRRFRVQKLDVNVVTVQVANYPDHVKILFQTSQKAPIRVKEFRDYIQVEFEEFLVRPHFPQTQPDAKLVSLIEFNPRDVYGAFRVYKGDYYFNFREYTMTDPDRKILEIYAPPVKARREAEKAPEAAEPEPSDVAQPSARDQPPEPTALVFQRRRPQNVITIDPGHGGEDYGVLPSTEILEKNFTIKIAGRVEQRLNGTGYEGLLTRRRDVDLPIDQRSSVANYYQSKVYVSIHAGGSHSDRAHGPVVYIHHYMQSSETAAAGNGSDLTPWEEGQRKYLDESRRLGGLMQKDLNSLYGTENKVAEVPLAVLAPVAAPAILVEVGFLTNAEDREKLSSPEFQEQIAKVIAIAVVRFLKGGETPIGAN